MGRGGFEPGARMVDMAAIVLNLLPPTWKRRIGARLVDFAIFAGLALVYPYGTILGFLYVAGMDALLRGQSIGKWMMGLQVRRLADGKPARMKESCLRNVPFLLLGLFALIPLIGVLLLATVGVLIVLTEWWVSRRDAYRRRAGDVLAATQVVPVKAFRLAIHAARSEADHDG